MAVLEGVPEEGHVVRVSRLPQVLLVGVEEDAPEVAGPAGVLAADEHTVVHAELVAAIAEHDGPGVGEVLRCEGHRMEGPVLHPVEQEDVVVGLVGGIVGEEDVLRVEGLAAHFHRTGAGVGAQGVLSGVGPRSDREHDQAAHTLGLDGVEGVRRCGEIGVAAAHGVGAAELAQGCQGEQQEGEG